MNSFGIDVQADRLIEFDSHDELRDLLASDSSLLAGRWAVLGGGNNILFSDDFHGTLFHPVGKKITITHEDDDSIEIHAEAGIEWDNLVDWCVGREVWGAENLSLIPGSVGAAPVQNIGAYGTEVGQSIRSVETLCTESLTKMTIAAAHCSFGYRESIFKHALRGKTIITAVNFSFSKHPAPKLEYGDLEAETKRLGGPSLQNIRQAVIHIRTGKLPDPKVTGNAGSFFKNPVVGRDVASSLKNRYPDMPVYPAHDPEKVKLAAGWLIDRAGWKGFSNGKAGVHQQQALVLVNLGNATGADILALAHDIQLDVVEKFGVRIDTEVNIF